jgi:hypothetical protein
MSTLVTATVKSNSSSPPAFQNSSGTQIGTLCRVWIQYNTITTTTITGSFNVSSLTDNGTGDTTINFTNALSDANYCVCASCSQSPVYNMVATPFSSLSTSPSVYSAGTSSSFRLGTYRRSDGNVDDVQSVFAAVFR